MSGLSYLDASFHLDNLIRTGTATVDNLSNLVVDTMGRIENARHNDIFLLQSGVLADGTPASKIGTGLVDQYREIRHIGHSAVGKVLKKRANSLPLTIGRSQHQHGVYGQQCGPGRWQHPAPGRPLHAGRRRSGRCCYHQSGGQLALIVQQLLRPAHRRPRSHQRALTGVTV